MPKSAPLRMELPQRDRHSKGPSGFSNLWLYGATIGIALYKGCLADPSNESPQEQTTIAQAQTQLETRHTAVSVLNPPKLRSSAPLRHDSKRITAHTRRSARLVLR
ncbi:hypothetical protein KBB08_02810 [Candidatus Gracilibacteria bacterium]|nr:hypothetical protein [Candidatus Gracilibacteria bacterium]